MDGILTISFNDPEQRIKKSDINRVALNIFIEVAYKKANGSFIHADDGYCSLDYFNVRSCAMKLRNDVDYDVE